ncbi:hypothetical protein [Neobacillus mesonae]|uniref:hypothetical protein n=1 Tax=Neobacillus mesonae TaxID=1193713 RepID=UPI00203C92A2|nr:hypothetical protein [Neobacillus mesonae]MCM3567947.1 hypothetical protein [Neobacillus mesonae]
MSSLTNGSVQITSNLPYSYERKRKRKMDMNQLNEVLYAQTMDISYEIRYLPIKQPKKSAKP